MRVFFVDPVDPRDPFAPSPADSAPVIGLDHGKTRHYSESPEAKGFFMVRPFLLALLAGLVLLATACSNGDDDWKPSIYLTAFSYWRPISDPNVFMPQSQAQTKLNHDLAQCRCSNYPMNYPHSEAAVMQPDLGRLAETSATKIDTQTGCLTSPEGVLIECMRARGWEPTSCSGRLNTPGGTTCALATGDVVSYPDSYPYQNPYLYNPVDEEEPTGPQARQRYP